MSERETQGLTLISGGQTEISLAGEYKKLAREALEPICEIINAARQKGLILNFQVGTDAYGKTKVLDVSIVRPL